MKVSDLEIAVIKSYRVLSKPIHSLSNLTGVHFLACRYEPSCSHYAEEAIRKYGTVKGTIMAAKRIMRCMPPYGGKDPVR